MGKLYKSEQDLWNSAYSAVFLVLVIGLTYYLKSQGKIVNNIPIFDYFVLILAVFRLIRLFVYDTVMGFLRRYFGEFETGPKKTASDLLSCPWCTGMWMALVVLFIYFVVPYSFLFLLLLSIAGIGSIIQIIIWKIGRE
jgi:hypothetical protein